MIADASAALVFSVLTNKPTEVIDHHDITDKDGNKKSLVRESFWTKLKSVSKLSVLMVCSTAKNTGAYVNLNGLIPNHAYQVLSAHEVVSKGKVRRLVKVRNPHGANIWKGKWSPSSKYWSIPSVKQLSGSFSETV